MQYHAQFIDCGCSDRLPMSHTAESIAAHTIVVDQGIFGDASVFHCFPTVIVANHMGIPPITLFYVICKILNISK